MARSREFENCTGLKKQFSKEENMFNKKYTIVIKHYDYFTGNNYKEIVANNIKEVEEIKKSSTWFIDNDHYQKIVAIVPQWVFQRPTHQSGPKPTVDDLPWSSDTISNDCGIVRDIKINDIFVDKDEYVFDKGDVVF